MSGDDPLLFSGLIVSAMMDQMIGQKKQLADVLMNSEEFVDFFIHPAVDIGHFHEGYQWSIQQK